MEAFGRYVRLAAAKTKVVFILLQRDERGEANGDGGTAISIIEVRDDFGQRGIARPGLEVSGDFPLSSCMAGKVH